ncbi:MAG: hypothetical protein ACFE95_13910 [Candidatus Hodarchaeota archaeon]
MSSRTSVNRILVVGREVGSIVKLLKEKTPKVLIGAVDVLGNQETRLFSDWAFSVEKQTPDVSVLRSKHRDLLELLYELTKVMLEDLEFDLLVPLSPFHTRPNYIQELSREINIAFSNISSLEKTSSTFNFLKTVSSEFPNTFSPDVYLSESINLKVDDFPFILISKFKTKILSSKASLHSITVNKTDFIFPVPQIHCAFFIANPNILHFLGLQTLSSPYQHSFFSDHFEKNALIPFSSKSVLSIKEITSFCSSIINTLEIQGLVTVYFSVIEDSFFPISCTVIPDENFEVWENRITTTLAPFLISRETKSILHLSASKFAFKFPIYSFRPIRVPFIPKEFASQRNLMGVISNPEYPLCAISGSGSTFSDVQTQIQEKKSKIIKILNSIA